MQSIIKPIVRGIYDIQKLRIEMGNRIFGQGLPECEAGIIAFVSRSIGCRLNRLHHAVRGDQVFEHRGLVVAERLVEPVIVDLVKCAGFGRPAKMVFEEKENGSIRFRYGLDDPHLPSFRNPINGPLGDPVFVTPGEWRHIRYSSRTPSVVHESMKAHHHIVGAFPTQFQ